MYRPFRMGGSQNTQRQGKLSGIQATRTGSAPGSVQSHYLDQLPPILLVAEREHRPMIRQVTTDPVIRFNLPTPATNVRELPRKARQPTRANPLG